MKTIFKLLGVTLVGLMAITGGAAAATGDIGVVDTDAQVSEQNGNTAGNQWASDNATAADGTNSPWVTGDERLDRFQDRFTLTDDQIETIQDEVTALIEGDATPDEIRSTITELLSDYGVENPALGHAAAGGQGTGPFGPESGPHGSADGPGHGAQGAGNGPHGPADGSCLN